jgi:hypothetical protein
VFPVKYELHPYMSFLEESQHFDAQLFRVKIVPRIKPRNRFFGFVYVFTKELSSAH